MQDKSVIRFLLDACENAHVHPGKLPLLPGGETKHNKSKVAATIRISDAIVLEITGLLGSGSFARVYSVTTKLNGASQVLALKVLTDHEGTAEPVLIVMLSRARRKQNTCHGSTLSSIRLDFVWQAEAYN